MKQGALRNVYISLGRLKQWRNKNKESWAFKPCSRSVRHTSYVNLQWKVVVMATSWPIGAPKRSASWHDIWIILCATWRKRETTFESSVIISHLLARRNKPIAGPSRLMYYKSCRRISTSPAMEPSSRYRILSSDAMPFASLKEARLNNRELIHFGNCEPTTTFWHINSNGTIQMCAQFG